MDPPAWEWRGDRIRTEHLKGDEHHHPPRIDARLSACPIEPGLHRSSGACAEVAVMRYRTLVEFDSIWIAFAASVTYLARVQKLDIAIGPAGNAPSGAY